MKIISLLILMNLEVGENSSDETPYRDPFKQTQNFTRTYIIINKYSHIKTKFI